MATSSSLSHGPEVTRIQLHLAGALELFDRRSDVAALDPAARLTRMLLRQALVEYTAEGRFPLNHDHAERRPSFIDDHGTRCAMAHLMELGGASALVAEVARDANHAYVDQLANDPRFVDWLVAAGLTVEEAARIQPQYELSARDCLCEIAIGGEIGGASLAGVIEARILVNGDAHVELIHGTAPVPVGGTIKVSLMPNVGAGHRVLIPIPATATADSTFLDLIPIEANNVVGRVVRPINHPFRHCGESGPLLAKEVADLRLESQASCYTTLRTKDPCYLQRQEGSPGFEPYQGRAARESSTPGDCVYGFGIVPPRDAGADASTQEAIDASTTNGFDANAPPPFDAGPNVDPGWSGAGSPQPTPGPDPLASITVGGTGSGCATTGSEMGSASSVAVLLAVVGAMLARQSQRRNRG